MAKALPFVPDALPLTNFLKRAHDEFSRHRKLEDADRGRGTTIEEEEAPRRSRYETPWVLVFDSVHWQDRDSELARFQRDWKSLVDPCAFWLLPVRCWACPSTTCRSSKSWRSSITPSTRARRCGSVVISIDFSRFMESRALTSSGNRSIASTAFNRLRALQRSGSRSRFGYKVNMTSLSQSRTGSTVHSRPTLMTPRFKLLFWRIAALSSERLPLPEALLPPPSGPWPVSHLLEDARAKLAIAWVLSGFGLTARSTGRWFMTSWEDS